MSNTKNRVIEFASFTLAEGVDESTFTAASDALQAEFFSQQKGFIKRELGRTANGKWADVVYWDSMESVEQAMQSAPGNPAALKYFQLMVNTDHNDSDAQIMLLNITKSYS